MNEYINFLRADTNWLWALAALISGGMWLSTLIPTAHRRKTIPAQKAVLMMNDSALLIDVREKNEFVQGHIPNARNMPMAGIAEQTDKLSKDSPIILTCATGARAQNAFKTLSQKGFQNLFVLESGLDGWKSAGLPIVKKG